MPTWRGNPNYADGTPGSTDRITFETNSGLPRGVAPSNWLTSIAADTAPFLGGNLDGQGFSVIDVSAPHVTGVSGTLTQAAHGGRPCLITGTVTVPANNGFWALLRNKSGAGRTVQPLSGVLIHEGTTTASIVLPNNRDLFVHGDGTDIWVSGAIV